jgi:hypothetical protein
MGDGRACAARAGSGRRRSAARSARGLVAIAVIAVVAPLGGPVAAAGPAKAASLAAGPRATAAVTAAASPRVESAWSASFGGAAAKGTASARILDTGAGSVAVSLRGLKASATYVVAVRRGACPAPGKVVASLGTAKATGVGTLTATRPLTAAQAAALRAATSGTGRASVTVTGAGRTACATFVESAAVTPRIWFAPLPPMPQRPGRMYVGSTDFAALFAPSAPWTKVAGRTHVFKMYGEWLGGTVTDAELRRVVSALEARRIEIAIEAGPLIAGACGEGVEGFAGGSAEALRLIRRVEAAGGRVRYVAMDEPYFFASLYDGPNACRWPVEQVAAEVARFVQEVRAARPSIVIGDIEPLAGAATAGRYEEWMAAFRSVAGAPLPFFHLDLDWGRTGWPAESLRLQEYARSHGTRFGMIYNGTAEPTDAMWLGAAWSHVATHELDGAGPPDDAVFQSWTDKPDRVLPESGTNTFTGLIARYVRARTALDVAAARGAEGPRAMGRLRTLGGAPVVGAHVAVAATPLDGAYQVLEVAGTVPAGATHAVVGIRVNQEGAGPADADLTVYEVGYAEGAGGTNLVADPTFAQGLDRWDWWGDGTVTTPDSDRGSGRMLRVVAPATRSLGINSGGFPVTAGADFRAWIAVRVPSSSADAAYVAPIFLAADEVRRDIRAIAPAPIPLGTATTDASGGFAQSLIGLEAGLYRVTVEWPGDATRWTARARTEVRIP